jgi:hypothetical protein
MGSCHRDGTFGIFLQAPGLRIPLTRSCHPFGRPEVSPAHAYAMTIEANSFLSSGA